MRTILMRYARARPSLNLSVHINALASTLSAISTAPDLGTLLGIEGSGTAHYFSAFPAILGERWSFERRSRRPPLDAVNAALGFAYALLENQVERAVSITGLDPYCGFFHQDVYGRQGLVLDLMEEFRPVIADAVVISCCTRSILDPSTDFEERDGGVYLNEPGRQKFFRAFETRTRVEVILPDGTKTTYARVCEFQARALAKAIHARSTDYAPFLVK